MYTKEELQTIMIDAIAGQKHHEHYKRTVDLAVFYKQIMTGNCQDKYVLQYKPRETDEQKIQRLSIYNSRTQFVSNKVYSIIDRLRRVDNVVDNMYYMDSEEKPEEVERYFMDFHNNQSFNDYIHDTTIYYNFYDPNAWIGIDFMKGRDGKTYPFPVEYHSEQVYHYEIINNKVTYFIARQKVDGLDVFTMLAPDWSIIVRQKATDVSGQIEIKDVEYDIEVRSTVSKQTPVFQVGYLRDAETDRKTFVGILEAAEKPYKRLINDGIEYDLSKALHGFLQKYQYGNVCSYFEETEDGNNTCIDGIMSITNKHCDKCQGTGLVMHRSTQDIILMKYPDDKSEHIPLKDMVYYVEIPIELMKIQKENINDDIEEILSAIFNSQLPEMVGVQGGAKTATENMLSFDNIQNVLYKCGNNISRVYKNMAMQVAIYMDSDEKLIIDHAFPTDLQLETLDMLLGQRDKAVKAGVPYAIIENIDAKILVKQSQGNSDNVQWVQTWEKFRPWKDITENERSFIIAEMSPQDKLRVRFVYYDEIKRNIENDYPKFYVFDNKEQEKLIDQYVLKYIPEVIAEPAQDVIFA